MCDTGAMAEQLAHKQTAKIKATMKSSITNAQLKDRKTSLLQSSRLHNAQLLRTLTTSALLTLSTLPHTLMSPHS